MSFPQPLHQIYTTDDIYALPEGERAELLDGDIYMMAPPSPRHQEYLGELYSQIHAYLKSKGGDCKPFIAPYAVFLNKDRFNYVEPDISVICDQNKLTDKGCEGAPDWIIEIVSPSSRKMDYYKKMLKYLNAGVREYWIVDPEKKWVTVHNFENDDFQEYDFSQSINAGIFEGLNIDFGQMGID